MAAYRWVDDLRSPAGCLPVHRDQLQAQRSVSSMGSLCLYLLPGKEAIKRVSFVFIYVRLGRVRVCLCLLESSARDGAV